MRNKVFGVVVGVILVGAAYPLLTRAQFEEAGGMPILAFNTMAPVTAPYLGNTNPIRTVPGGGKAWKIENGSGELEANGELRVSTRGLVLVATETNPIPMFRAIVSCRSIDGSGNPDVVNVSTNPYTADANGDSHVETKLDLPTPCMAPIVFVASPTGAWFAVTGK